MYFNLAFKFYEWIENGEIREELVGNPSCIEMKVQTRSTVPWRTWEPLEGGNLGNMLAR